MVSPMPCRAPALLLAAALAAGPARVEGALPQLGGWVTSWGLDEGLAQARARPAGLADVFLFVAALDPGGRPVLLRPEADCRRAAVELAAAGVTPWLTVVNDVVTPGRRELKSAPVTHRVIATADARRDHRRALLELARALRVRGLDVNYENLDPADRQSFSAFVAELAEDAHRAGLRLAVTVQPKRAESRSVGPGAADWRALCAAADRLQVMLYNEHGPRTGPGPVASLAWMDAVMGYALEVCPAERLFAAVKDLGMEWSPAGFRDLDWREATELLRRTGAAEERSADGVPSFAYPADGEVRTVWFEDGRSLAVKLAAVERRGLAGVVLWSLPQQDPTLWAAIDQGRQPSVTSPPVQP
jgi:spore germination protein YaaH